MASSTDLRQSELMLEIHEANLSYMMLAQQLIKADKITAMYTLGISVEVADLIEKLSNSQLIRLANSNMMLTRFRFDDKTVLDLLTEYDKTIFQSVAHTSILMSSQPVETM